MLKYTRVLASAVPSSLDLPHPFATILMFIEVHSSVRHRDWRLSSAGFPLLFPYATQDHYFKACLSLNGKFFFFFFFLPPISLSKEWNSKRIYCHVFLKEGWCRDIIVCIDYLSWGEFVDVGLRLQRVLCLPDRKSKFFPKEFKIDHNISCYDGNVTQEFEDGYGKCVRCISLQRVF